VANFHPNLNREHLYIKEASLKLRAPKKSEKVRNRFLLLPFVEGNVFAAFQIISSSGFDVKKLRAKYSSICFF
jgi:hypothetical protein